MRPHSARRADPTTASPVPPDLAPFRNFLRKRLPDPALADDILQQSLVKVLENNVFDVKENPTAWLYRVLRNAVADHYRAQAIRERVEDRLAAEPTSQDEEAEVCACLDALLPALNPDYAAVLRAVDRDGGATVEVARDLGITPGNLMVRLHRARRSLREKLQATCGICTRHGCLNCTCGS